MRYYMTAPWPTEQQDLATAAEIIQRYMQRNDGRPLGLFEIELKKGEKPNVRLSYWIMELAECFYRQYGRQQGDFVTKMVVSKCLKQGETVH